MHPPLFPPCAKRLIWAWLVARGECLKRFSPAEVAAFYDDLEREPGWLIVFTHDISDTPSAFGYTRLGLAGLVGEAARRGFVLATVDAAMDRLAGPVSNPLVMPA